MSRKRKKAVAEKATKMSENDLSNKLIEATKNLYYISETDAEITPFIGRPASAVTRQEVLLQIGKPVDEAVEERDFSEMFERLTKIQEWFGEEETETAKKFEHLRDLLTENLKDLKIYKIGRIELDVYVVGLDKRGILTGIKTKAVET